MLLSLESLRHFIKHLEGIKGKHSKLTTIIESNNNYGNELTTISKRNTIIMNYLLLNWKKVEGTILDLQQNIRTT